MYSPPEVRCCLPCVSPALASFSPWLPKSCRHCSCPKLYLLRKTINLSPQWCWKYPWRRRLRVETSEMKNCLWQTVSLNTPKSVGYSQHHPERTQFEISIQSPKCGIGTLGHSQAILYVTGSPNVYVCKADIPSPLDVYIACTGAGVLYVLCIRAYVLCMYLFAGL